MLVLIHTLQHNHRHTIHAAVQVLLACIKCPGGPLLTNDNVINIFQACFRIGHGDAHKVPNGVLPSLDKPIRAWPSPHPA